MKTKDLREEILDIVEQEHIALLLLTLFKKHYKAYCDKECKKCKEYRKKNETL